MDQIEEKIRLIKMPKLRGQLLKVYEKFEPKFHELPASTKFHHSWKGGLYDHTLEVIEFAIKIFEVTNHQEKGHGFTKDDVIFISFVHDFDKLDKYLKNPYPSGDQDFIYNRNRTDVNDDAKIVSILSEFGIKFESKHLNALTFSHGGWSIDRGKMEPLATLIHCADILSLNFGVEHERKD